MLRILYGIPLVFFGLFQTGTSQVSEKNLVENASFERVFRGQLQRWQWRPSRAKATLTIEDQVFRTGKHSILIANSAPAAPHVYSLMEQEIQVLPNKTYTISCYVRSENPGRAWIGGGPGWSYRFPFPKTGQEWRRVSGTVKTKPGQQAFRLLILSESPTKELRVDDVQFELGNKATAFSTDLPLEPDRSVLRITPVEPKGNLLPNPSFDIIDGNRPKHWMWDRRNTDATMDVVEGDAHSGTHSIRFTNGTPFGAHVYGWFGLLSGLEVKPDTPYTVSCWVKSKDPGIAWIGGGTRWRVRLRLPATGARWLRVERSFVTEKEETHIPFMVLTESPTPGFQVDDVMLEEGTHASPFIPEDKKNEALVNLSPRQAPPVFYRGRPIVPVWALSRTSRALSFVNSEFWATGLLYVPPEKTGAALAISLLGPGGEVVAETATDGPLAPGSAHLDFGCFVGNLSDREVVLQAQVKQNGKVLAESNQEMQLMAKPVIAAAIDQVEELAHQLQPLVEKLEAKGEGQYARSTLTVLDNFLGFAREDLFRKKPDRAWDAAQVMKRMVRREISTCQKILAGQQKALVAPEYVTSPIQIAGPSFLASVRWPGRQQLEQRPVFFIGYGHFGQVRRDVEKFPRYGANLIQIEFGPRSVLPNEKDFSDSAINEFLKVCDRAEKAGVSVNLLMSPHYFPDWALKKWPFLKECSGGFFKYCIHARESRAVLEKSLRRVLPRIKDHPALHSICLSNEPISTDVTKCRYLPAQWQEWLRNRHKTVQQLNQRWHSQYPSFAAIKLPEPKIESRPLIYDFVRFNQGRLVEFHQWMADVIHSMAPELPVHAKIMMGAHFARNLHGIWSVSPELFAGLSQINGNDCIRWYRRRGGEWASDWLQENMAYDFQRSMADRPIFNSENHLIVDRDLDVIPPEFCHNVMWQGAIHGQSATTIWVWERTYNPLAASAGSILHRPDCAEAVGWACLDLNRLAPEVTAIQKLRPEVVLFWSLASTIQGEQHRMETRRIYTALNFTGLPIGFVTERQLAQFAKTRQRPRPLEKAKVILAPGVTRLTEGALAGLREFTRSGGKVFCTGQAPADDEYGFPLPAGPDLNILQLPDSDGPALQSQLEAHLPEWGIKHQVRAIDENGQTAWGVELRAVQFQGAWTINLCNHLRETKKVRLLLGGQPVRGYDLLSGEALDREFVLSPLVSRLVKLVRGRGAY